METPVTREEIQARLVEVLTKYKVFDDPAIGCEALGGIYLSLLCTLLVQQPELLPTARRWVAFISQSVEEAIHCSNGNGVTH